MKLRPPASIGATPLACVLALVGTSCVLGTEGRPPDPAQIYYPTGIAVSPGRTVVYVANSDFDLQYSGGSIQAFDARALRKAVLGLARSLSDGVAATQACADAGLAANDAAFMNPGPCESFAVQPFLKNTVFIGAFASKLLLVHPPEGRGARLFSPVRGDPSLTYVDVEDDRAPSSSPSFRLDCNVGGDGFCGSDHRVGQSSSRSLRGLQLPSDPVGSDASSDGAAIVSAHQTQSAASLVVNDWESVPYLSYFANNYAAGPIEVVALPRPAFVLAAASAASAGGFSFDTRDTFIMTYRGSPLLDLVEHFPDSGSVPPRPFLVRAQQVPLTISASNVDSRGITVVATERQACEAGCGAGEGALACLASCAEEIPMRVFVANRAPASLLVGRIRTVLAREATDSGGERLTAAFHDVEMYGSIPLDYGASRVRVGKVVAEDGTLIDRVFATAFDSRSVFIVDPVTERVEAVVRTGRGPQEIAVDSGEEDGEPYAIGYVAHFTDSYLGVIDLDLRRPATYGHVVASIGAPLPPVEAR